MIDPPWYEEDITRLEIESTERLPQLALWCHIATLAAAVSLTQSDFQTEEDFLAQMPSEETEAELGASFTNCGATESLKACTNRYASEMEGQKKTVNMPRFIPMSWRYFRAKKANSQKSKDAITKALKKVFG